MHSFLLEYALFHVNEMLKLMLLAEPFTLWNALDNAKLFHGGHESSLSLSLLFPNAFPSFIVFGKVAPNGFDYLEHFNNLAFYYFGKPHLWVWWMIDHLWFSPPHDYFVWFSLPDVYFPVFVDTCILISLYNTCTLAGLWFLIGYCCHAIFHLLVCINWMNLQSIFTISKWETIIANWITQMAMK